VEASGSVSSNSSVAHTVLLKRSRYEVRQYAEGPPQGAAWQGGAAQLVGSGGAYGVAAFGGAAGEQQAQAAEQALRQAGRRGRAGSVHASQLACASMKCGLLLVCEQPCSSR
jgi:hypothetical protein